MRTWKMWLFGSLLIVILTIAAIVSALWNHMSSEWDGEATAAQLALNHTALDSITSHSVFSGPGGVEQVFQGIDAFNRTGIAFVNMSSNQTVFLPAKDVIPATQALSYAHRYVQQPIGATLGYLTTQAKSDLHTSASFVWEVTYLVHHQYGYLYLDAQSGQLVWWK